MERRQAFTSPLSNIRLPTFVADAIPYALMPPGPQRTADPPSSQEDVEVDGGASVP